jgi:hypothetical protein
LKIFSIAPVNLNISKNSTLVHTQRENWTDKNNPPFERNLTSNIPFIINQKSQRGC